MNFLHPDKLKPIFWLAVISSWTLGVVTSRWIGIDNSLIELSKAVRVTNPLHLKIWWELLAAFVLSTVSIFVLSHILLGIGGTIFFFARGLYDSSLIAYIESTITSWSITTIPMSEVWPVLITIFILTINLPLCLWAGKLGTQRSVYILYRLRGKPINPDFGSKPLSELLKIVSVSLIAGLAATILFSYMI